MACVPLYGGDGYYYGVWCRKTVHDRSFKIRCVYNYAACKKAADPRSGIYKKTASYMGGEIFGRLQADISAFVYGIYNKRVVKIGAKGKAVWLSQNRREVHGGKR